MKRTEFQKSGISYQADQFLSFLPYSVKKINFYDNYFLIFLTKYCLLIYYNYILYK